MKVSLDQMEESNADWEQNPHGIMNAVKKANKIALTLVVVLIITYVASMMLLSSIVSSHTSKIETLVNKTNQNVLRIMQSVELMKNQSDAANKETIQLLNTLIQKQKALKLIFDQDKQNNSQTPYPHKPETERKLSVEQKLSEPEISLNRDDSEQDLTVTLIEAETQMAIQNITTRNETINLPQVNYSQVRIDQGYMTNQLERISDKRRQKGGSTVIKQGTVSELSLFKWNKAGQGQTVVKLEQTRKKRQKFIKERVQFIDWAKSSGSVNLIKYNILTHPDQQKEQKLYEHNDWLKINWFFRVFDITKQLPICVVVPSYNNNANFRLEANLNSIFSQNYTNYFVVLINDASTDGSDELFRKYLHHYDIDSKKYVYIQNKYRKKALSNIYNATHQYCSQDSILMIVDGDDELVGRNVLKVFNVAYQRYKAGVVYSNFFFYEQGKTLKTSQSAQYTQNERKDSSYRSAPFRVGHLTSYRTQLFRKIAVSQFKDSDGEFYAVNYDKAIFYPVMQRACGKVSRIRGYHYLYNLNTGLNDYELHKKEQTNVSSVLRSQKPLHCDEQFKKNMDQTHHG